jgi:hypothetical protein
LSWRLSFRGPGILRRGGRDGGFGPCRSGLRDGLRWNRGYGCRSCVGSFLTLCDGGLALDFAHFLLEGAFEIAAGFAEFGHEFAKSTGKLRQLVRAENDQNNDEDDNHVWNAKHSLA